jgi:hypothetical protein
MLLLTSGAIGCQGGGSGGSEAGGGAGTTAASAVPLESAKLPGCETGEPNLIEGFTLGREVDYIADRWGDEVLSARGVPCSGALDPALCQGKLDAAGNQFFRNLLTTKGDEVRIWEGPAAVSLFGGIDTVSEAAWLASAFEYHVPCNAMFVRVFDVYVIDGVEGRFGCIDTQALVTLSISPAGDVSELSFAFVEGAVCEPDPMSLGFAGGIPVPPSPPPDAF